MTNKSNAAHDPVAQHLFKFDIYAFTVHKTYKKLSKSYILANKQTMLVKKSSVENYT